MIEISNLTVRYGGVVSLDAVSVSLTERVAGLIGPNGAGKTTLMNAVSGFVEPASGEVRVHGLDVLTLAPHRRCQWGVGRSFQRLQVVPELSARDHIETVLDAKRYRGSRRRLEAERVLEFMSLRDEGDRPCGHTDAFVQRKTEIAKALTGEPRLVLLDEPFGGLSEVEATTLRGLVEAVFDFCGAAVLIIDHDVKMMRSLCGELAVLNFGQLVASGPSDEVLANEQVRSAYLGQ